MRRRVWVAMSDRCCTMGRGCRLGWVVPFIWPLWVGKLVLVEVSAVIGYEDRVRPLFSERAAGSRPVPSAQLSKTLRSTLLDRGLRWHLTNAPADWELVSGPDDGSVEPLIAMLRWFWKGPPERPRAAEPKPPTAVEPSDDVPRGCDPRGLVLSWLCATGIKARRIGHARGEVRCLVAT